MRSPGCPARRMLWRMVCTLRQSPFPSNPLLSVFLCAPHPPSLRTTEAGAGMFCALSLPAPTH
eukprot:scaffold15684_cov33-Tisochrysis_lutea.AAC.1